MNYFALFAFLAAVVAVTYANYGIGIADSAVSAAESSFSETKTSISKTDEVVGAGYGSAYGYSPYNFGRVPSFSGYPYPGVPFSGFPTGGYYPQVPLL